MNRAAEASPCRTAKIAGVFYLLCFLQRRACRHSRRRSQFHVGADYQRYGDDVDEAVSSTSTDISFRWDSSGQQWIFNISTANLTAGQTYVYRIQLNDGSFIAFRFGLN